MIKKKIKIINKLGLHARASSKLTQLASQFNSNIFIIKNKKKVNAKNIMDILMLAASVDSEVEIEANGSDEIEAIKQIEKLFQNYFEEGE
jgi:phosphocarrier protein HPr